METSGVRETDKKFVVGLMPVLIVGSFFIVFERYVKFKLEHQYQSEADHFKYVSIGAVANGYSCSGKHNCMSSFIYVRQYQIQYEAFSTAGGLYNERHAKLYAELALSLVAYDSFSIVYEGVAHACYTPIIEDEAPHLKGYVLAPLVVLPAYQGKGYATRLMGEAEKQLNADVIFVMGEPFHYGNRYNTHHKVLPPVKMLAPLECWFARELTQGALDGVGESTSSITALTLSHSRTKMSI
ncbi:GNAT family N-acetyltransferase [Photobacterium profundum]